MKFIISDDGHLTDFKTDNVRGIGLGRHGGKTSARKLIEIQE